MKKLLLIVCVVCCLVFTVSAQQSTDKASKQSLKSIDWTPKYKGEINVGYAIAGNRFKFDHVKESSNGSYFYNTAGIYRTDFSRPLFETTHGVQVGPYFFVGAGLGLQYYYGKLKEFYSYGNFAATAKETKPIRRWNAVMLPIFANVKLMYPVNDKFTPFLNISLGGTVGCYSSVNYTYEFKESNNNGVEWDNIKERIRTQGGLYCDVGVGFRYKAFNFSLGLQHQVLKLVDTLECTREGAYLEDKIVMATPVDSFYVKVGVNF